jgi:hypothetical protein
MNGVKSGLLLGLLLALGTAALVEFITQGLARRTFVFYTGSDGLVIVEQRMLRVSKGNTPVSGGRASEESQHSLSREINIARYVEEALLGPVSPNSLPLFPRETRLLSLLYRDEVVYVDLSEDAALPLVEGALLQGEGVLKSLTTLYSGIRRNFPYVRDVHFFITGKAAYPGDEFHQAGEFALKNGI